MRIIKTLLIGLSLIILFHTSMAQDHNTALGLRVGYPSGITAKHFFGKKSALEGIVSFGWGGVGLTGLYELHNEVSGTDGLNWYYGLGAHIATAKADKHNPWENKSGDEFFLGADGIIGLEYTFKNAPINLSVDIMPIINVVESPGIWFNAGLSVRYAFK
ncbi:MAG: hypothetical protein AB7S48_14295 [Bacteroidales bacterium]